MKKNKIVYDSNNSGGSWWLKDQDWFNLEKAGWTVDWFKNNPSYKSERWLGGLASGAYKENISLKKAIEEFEDITNQSVYEEGCECCGQPHNFYEE